MKQAFSFKWFRDISISRKLYFTVGIMAVLIGVELFALSFSINTLSSVRAFVGGEGLWSKGQKDASYSLLNYGHTRDEADYKQYQQFMQVPMGDSKARAEMMKPNPDLNVARQGFIQGRNHPDDVDGMIKLFARFNKVYYINRAIVLWGQAEAKALKLIPISEQLHAEINSAQPSQQKIDALLKQIPAINKEITPLEDEFSFTLGAGSRWLEGLVLKILFGIALTVEITGLLLAISVSHSIQKGLTEIISAAKAFTAGKRKTRSKVFSNDEIGVLANSFNQMSDQLEGNIQELEDAQVKFKELLETLQQSESEVRALNESLEKKVAERTMQLEQANSELEFFSYSVSHDLRTPLRSINGFSKILSQKYESKLDDDGKEFLQLISDNAIRMSVLIDGLLKLGRVDRGAIAKSEVDMNAMVGDLVHELKLEDVEMKAEIRINNIESAKCDPVLTKQVWANLISNAVKYSRKTNSPVVEIGSIPDNGKLVYYVKDNGAGFDMQYSNQLFSAFKRLHDDKDFEGTGVGLALVQRIVARHGGTIWAESEVGKGAAFYFTLLN